MGCHGIMGWKTAVPAVREDRRPACLAEEMRLNRDSSPTRRTETTTRFASQNDRHPVMADRLAATRFMS